MSQLITDHYRGIPNGTRIATTDIASLELSPASGNMPLPVLTLDEAHFQANIDLMLDYCARSGVLIAPHAKTPMAPVLAQRIIAAGAWGASVANVQQATVMLAHGIERLILANEIGGLQSGKRLGALLSRYPDAECLAFADSTACLESLAAAGQARGKPISVLLELGAGRGGARSLDDIKHLADWVARHPEHLAVKGIAAYEGSAEAADEAVKTEVIRRLLSTCIESAAYVKEVFGLDTVIFTAGGSSYFDLICDAAAAAAIPGLTTILRSGAIFFSDHGAYEQAMARMQQRGGAIPRSCQPPAEYFSPALRVWAEILSNPEPGLYICGMGKRDVSHDIDLPRPLALYRDGERLSPEGAPLALAVTQLNDQHAFLQATTNASPTLRVGDIIEFGISHPCTCIDKWRLIYGLRDQRISAAYATYFG